MTMAQESVAESVAGQLFSEDGTSVFAVLDGASISDLQERLYDLQPEYECLYTGELEPDMAEVAPYLVALQKGSQFTNWVIGKGWGKHWGIFAVTTVDLRVLRRHFRTFLTVYDPEGKPMLFRFYDPRVLRVYIPTCNPEELETVFGPVDKYVLEGEDPGTVIGLERYSGLLSQRKTPLTTT